MLADAHCRNASCLCLPVSPAGSKHWFMKYHADGKEKQLALGRYPQVGLTAACKARDAAKLLLA
ncbi:Arm DNA-binding domain-containing protein [Corticibacter populi]|uniref:Arm DNA-binding domain-containing protein n=1 Tax=Corticibacter populi TaxID=1550736 RepID=UPI001F5EADA7|nr:Arm DNA-binding domain-containing protein [Corticibacter populi]